MNVTAADTGISTINGWTLSFAFPSDQKVTNAWNATVSQSGATVMAASVGYNGSLSPGASASFGFHGTWVSSDAAPTYFTLNGAICG